MAGGLRSGRTTGHGLGLLGLGSCLLSAKHPGQAGSADGKASTA